MNTWQHNLLPRDAQEALKRAANHWDPDPVNRARYVDHAIEGIKRKYPRLFREEQ